MTLMTFLQIGSLIIWILGSFLIARFLYKKHPLFTKTKGIFVLFSGFVVFVILHNLVYSLFKSYFDAQNGDEGLFFTLSFLSLGTAIFLLLIQLLKKTTKKPSGANDNYHQGRLKGENREGL